MKRIFGFLDKGQNREVLAPGPSQRRQVVEALALIANAISEADRLNDGPEKRKQVRAWTRLVEQITTMYGDALAKDVAAEACEAVGVTQDW